MTLCYCLYHPPTSKGKIRTRGPRHSREVCSDSFLPNNELTLDICNHQPVSLPVGAQSACQIPGMRWALWIYRFRLDNLRDFKCIPALQVLKRLHGPCSEGRLKKEKEKLPAKLVGFNFLCLRMSWVVFYIGGWSASSDSHSSQSCCERRGEHERMFSWTTAVC